MASDRPIRMDRGLAIDILYLQRVDVQLQRDGRKPTVEVIVRLGKSDRADSVGFALVGDDARTLAEALLGIAPPDTRKRIAAEDVSSVNHGSLDRD